MNTGKIALMFGVLLLTSSFALAQEAPTTIEEVWESSSGSKPRSTHYDPNSMRHGMD